MAEKRRRDRSRFSLGEVIAEPQNDSDSGESDLYSDSESEEDSVNSISSSQIDNDAHENG